MFVRQPDTTRTIQLLEQAVGYSSPLRIDEDAGIIYGVKVCGFTSPNCPNVPGQGRPTKGTKYTRAALQQAARLYENIEVNWNHRAKNLGPYAERPAEDNVGVLRNVRLEADGLRAEFHFRQKHQYAATIVEDVQRRFGTFGLSHEAAGNGRIIDGWLVIEEIPKVRSVDIVDDPATNINLWESQQMPMITLRESLKKLQDNARDGSPLAQWTGWILEADAMAEKNPDGATSLFEDGEETPISDTPVEDVPGVGGSSDHRDALKSGFREALMHLCSDESIDSMEPQELLKLIKQILFARVKLTGASPPTDTPPEPGTEDIVPDTSPEMEESRSALAKANAENAALKNRLALTDLCESMSFRPSDIQRKAMATLSESDRSAFIREAQAQSTRPKSYSPQDFVRDRVATVKRVEKATDLLKN